ncbi:hypothetical protein [Paramagnetospirillum magneticum]|uniref:ABC-type transport auxiliary lipoprotein component domain-containing protein n=1 Tax=Paramagnetospirillum magneticum (strain ATCC 700264 / AMB-1) TaxID=342108 RepID=Q2W9S9_PARM1|nr:hypothetical protein [Paramagnetospirillum magneticum]BAE49396.1 hypothetical protein amb0592 [Paramagnetospirillum magneticum AMB-1]
MRRLSLLLLLLLTTACGDIPQPFRHEGLNAAVSPPGPRGVVVRPPDDSPSGAALAKAIIKRLSEQDIPASSRSAAAGSWVLAATPETSIATKRLVWRLIPPDGDIPAAITQSLPAALWETAGPATIDRMADEVVAKYAATLHGEPEQPLDSAPARVPAIRLEPLAGLPGDGDSALSRALGQALRRLGLRLGGPEADVTVLGRITLVPGRPGEEILDVTWVVQDARTGKELGKAAQQGALPKGRLSGPWGALAGDIAAGGAEGIADIIAAIPQK